MKPRSERPLNCPSPDRYFLMHEDEEKISPLLPRDLQNGGGIAPVHNVSVIEKEGSTLPGTERARLTQRQRVQEPHQDKRGQDPH